MRSFMYDLPRPPTDNLYKFPAITGLVLFVISIVFPIRWWYDLKMEEYRLEQEKEVCLVDYRVWYVKNLFLQIDQIGYEKAVKVFSDKNNKIFSEQEKEDIRNLFRNDPKGKNPEDAIFLLQLAEFINSEMKKTEKDKQTEKLFIDELSQNKEKGIKKSEENLEFASQVDKQRAIIAVKDQQIYFLQKIGWFLNIFIVLALVGIVVLTVKSF